MHSKLGNRLRDCMGSQNRGRVDSSGIEDLEDPPSYVVSPEVGAQEVKAFVCKTLLIKVVQFVIISGYFFFIDNLPRAFLHASIWWTVIPSFLFVSIFLFVRLRRNPPHYAVIIIMVMVSSFSFAYLVGIAFTRYRFHIISLPLSILFVYTAYLLLIPLFFCQVISTKLSKRKYHLIPLWIVWIQNGLLVGVVAFLRGKPDYYGMDNKFDMLCLFCLPTALSSTTFTWFSMLHLRQITEGEWFLVIYDEHFHDYLYAALYMI